MFSRDSHLLTLDTGRLENIQDGADWEWKEDMDTTVNPETLHHYRCWTVKSVKLQLFEFFGPQMSCLVLRETRVCVPCVLKVLRSCLKVCVGLLSCRRVR